METTKEADGANMSVTIKVNSEQFNALLRNQIENLPDEVWKDIIKQAVGKALNDENGVANTLIRKRSVYYGSDTYEVGDVLKAALSHIDFSDVLAEVGEKAKELLRTKWQDILLTAIWDKLSDDLMSSPSFSEALRVGVRREIEELRQQRNG